MDKPNQKQVHDYLLSFEGAELTYPFGEQVAVYKVPVGKELKMFALVAENQSPVNISLKCDPNLAIRLREKYETVLPGYHLNKKHWNTIIASGQLSWQELQDLINLSHQLVTKKDDAS